MKGLPRYKTTLYVPQSILFDVLTIDFAGPFAFPGQGKRSLVVCVEPLTGLLVVAATERWVAGVIVHFMKTKSFTHLAFHGGL